MQFSADKWKREVNDSIDAYSALHDPIQFSGVLKQYYYSCQIVKDAVRGFKLRKLEKGVSISDVEIEVYKSEFVEENLVKAKTALETYNRQMAVLFCTYLELIISEFVHSLFTLNRQWMYDYVSVEKGKVEFNDIAGNSSLDELFEKLANKSTGNVMKGSWPSVFKRIERLIRKKLPQKDKMLMLISVRNEIVHEGGNVKVLNDNIWEFNDLLLGLISFCAVELSSNRMLELNP